MERRCISPIERVSNRHKLGSRASSTRKSRIIVPSDAITPPNASLQSLDRAFAPLDDKSMEERPLLNLGAPKPPLKPREKDSHHDVSRLKLSYVRNESLPKDHIEFEKSIADPGFMAEGGSYCFPRASSLVNANKSQDSYALLTCGCRAPSREKILNDFSPHATELMNVEGTSFISQPSILSKLAVPCHQSSNDILRDTSFFTLDALPSSSLLGEQLATVIRNLQVDGVRLPPCQIELPELAIKRSVRLLGSPGTQLILQHGTITIKSNGGPTVVSMKECAIILKVAAGTGPGPRCMFTVSNNTKLELQDCHLKTEYCVGHPYYIPASESRSSFAISDEICVNVLSEGSPEGAPDYVFEDSKKQGAEKSELSTQAGSVKFISCSFINFFTHLVAGRNSTVFIDKCGFFKCKGSALTSTNPMNLTIEGSIFEDCNTSGIDLKWAKDDSVAGDTKRTVRMEGNTVNESNGTGILISGDKIDTQTIKTDILIKSNRIRAIKQDGICIKYVNADSLEIMSNNISGTMSNGIGLYSSHCGSLVMDSNILTENSYCGVYIQEAACDIIRCECVSNGVSGIGIVGSPLIMKGHDSKELNVTDCVINSNKQSGISLLDFHTGTLNITNCKLDENKDYGLFLSCHESVSTTVSQSASGIAGGGTTVPAVPLSKVVLLQGQVKYNKRGGIYLSQQYTHVNCTNIKDNGEFAIYIPTREGEKDLAFASTTLTKKCINGHIGGRWGFISVYPTNAACGCAVCSIF